MNKQLKFINDQVAISIIYEAINEGQNKEQCRQTLFKKMKESGFDALTTGFEYCFDNAKRQIKLVRSISS